MSSQRATGIVIAPEGKSVRRSQENVLDTDIPQFKYYKTIYIKRIMPLVTDTSPTDINSISIQYPHGLPYTPTFDTFLKGHKGTWGKIVRGAQSIGIGGFPAFPYYGEEYIDQTNYSLDLSVYGGSTTGGIAAHEVVIRLTLLYDEVE